MDIAPCRNFRGGGYLLGFLHKVMKAKFHFGFYLFWLGWAVSCLYFISVKDQERKVTNEEIEKMKEVKNEE